MRCLRHVIICSRKDVCDVANCLPTLAASGLPATRATRQSALQHAACVFAPVRSCLICFALVINPPQFDQLQTLHVHQARCGVIYTL
jgi:hypothetical protein